MSIVHLNERILDHKKLNILTFTFTPLTLES